MGEPPDLVPAPVPTPKSKRMPILCLCDTQSIGVFCASFARNCQGGRALEAAYLSVDGACGNCGDSGGDNEDAGLDVHRAECVWDLKLMCGTLSFRREGNAIG